MTKTYVDGLNKARRIVANELLDESDRHDDNKGYLKSIHIGAMEALSVVLEKIDKEIRREKK